MKARAMTMCKVSNPRHQSCKRASFWSPNPARSRNHKPESGPSPTFIFQARKPNLPSELFTDECVRDAQLRGYKNVAYE